MCRMIAHLNIMFSGTRTFDCVARPITRALQAEFATIFEWPNNSKTNSAFQTVSRSHLVQKGKLLENGLGPPKC